MNSISFAILRQTSTTQWTGTFRGRPLEAALATTRERTIFNGETTAPDEVLAPDLQRSNLTVKIPSERLSFTLQHCPAFEGPAWEPATIGRSRAMVGRPTDLHRGALLFVATKIDWMKSLGIEGDNLDSWLATWSEATLSELADDGNFYDEDGSAFPLEPAMTALQGRREALGAYYEDVIVRIREGMAERAKAIPA
jgi:hypothetical protein